MKKANIVKSMISALLIGALMLTLCGCSLMRGLLSGLINDPPRTHPQATPTPVPTEPDANALYHKEQLAALDLDLFKSMILGDALSFMLCVEDPKSYGITEEEFPSGLGELTKEAFDEWTAECAAYQSRLERIDRSVLSEREQLSYDIIERFVADELAMSEYYYFSEPLLPYVGLQSNLPISFELLPLNSAEDIDVYIAALRDSERYFGQIAAFEGEKLAEGLFMNKSAADTVISDCEAFFQTGEECFLITDFAERIKDVGLTEAQREHYIEANASAVLEVLLPAYEMLANELTRLSITSEESGGSELSKGLYYVEGGEEFFAESIRQASCSDMSPEEIEELLTDTINGQYERLYAAWIRLPGGWEDEPIDMSMGSIQENLDYLRKKIAEDYPPLPEHEVRLYSVSESLEDSFSPAAYLIPPVDSAYYNTIIINHKAVGESETLLATVGHEGYPGHMYQYIYQRNLDDVGLLASVMSVTAYYEGWSQYAEDYVFTNTCIDRSLGDLLAADSLIGNALYPALISVYVNGCGWELADVESYLADFGMESLAEYYYEYAVNMPTYYFDYAIGYSCFYRLLNAYKEEKGAAFDPYTFHEEYLSYGPAYFDMLEERMLEE